MFNIATFRFFLLSSILIAFLFPNYSVAKCPTRMGSVYPQDFFLVIAHRGSTIKFPENTIPAFKESLNIDGANSLAVDLSLTKDRKIVLWHDWDLTSPIAMVRKEKGEEVSKFKPYGPPLVELRAQKRVSEFDFSEFVDNHGYKDKITYVKTNFKIPTFQDLIEWAVKQDKLKLLILKLRAPIDEKYLIPVMFKEIRRTVRKLGLSPRFQFVISVSNKESLKLLRSPDDNFLFSFDRKLPPSGIVNYHQFTTVPVAMNFKNKFSGIGFPRYSSAIESKLDPWAVYKFVLTWDLKIRDNYKNATSNHINIISWVFNDKKKIKCLINLGVDGIVTDKPKMLREIALNMGKILH